MTAHVIGTPEHRGVAEAVRGHVENFRSVVLGLVEVVRGRVGFTASFEFLGIVGITVIDVVIGGGCCRKGQEVGRGGLDLFGGYVSVVLVVIYGRFIGIDKNRSLTNRF